MEGRFPFINVQLFDDALPLDAELEAFNPFIPLNADDSGIPVALLRYKLRNRGEKL